jgi:hypothetical protein
MLGETDLARSMLLLRSKRAFRGKIEAIHPTLEEKLEENQKRAACVCSPFTYFLRKSGEPSRTRTCDPLVKSQLLYQLSYRPTNEKQSKVSSLKFQVRKESTDYADYTDSNYRELT